jgi:hypothetical protein
MAYVEHVCLNYMAYVEHVYVLITWPTLNMYKS